MQLRVKTLTRRTFGIDVHPCASIEEVKARLTQETGISLTGQRLVHKGEVLRHGTLSDYGVTPTDFIVVVVVRPPAPSIHLSSPLDMAGREGNIEKSYTSPKKTEDAVLDRLINNAGSPLQPSSAAPVSSAASPGRSGVSASIRDVLHSLGSPARSVPVNRAILGAGPMFDDEGVDDEEMICQVDEDGVHDDEEVCLGGGKHGVGVEDEEEDEHDDDEDEDEEDEDDGDGDDDDERVRGGRRIAVGAAALHQLVDMGFPENRVEKALLLCGGDTQIAMEWLLEHSDDADIDVPLTEEQLRMLREEDEDAYGEDEEAYGEDEEAYGEDEEAYHERESRMDQEALQRLTEMGFTEDDILSALEHCGNSFEEAAAWLLGDRDESDIGEEEEEEEEEEGMHLAHGGAHGLDGIDHNRHHHGDEESYLAGADGYAEGDGLASLMHSLQGHLSNPRVAEAFRNIVEQPRSASHFLNDPEISRILQAIGVPTGHPPIPGDEEGQDIEGGDRVQ